MKKIIFSTLFLSLVTLLSAQPDLRVSNIKFVEEPPKCGPGQYFSTMLLTIENFGNKPAYGTDVDSENGYHIDIILSSDNSAPIRYAPNMAALRFPEDCLVVNGRIKKTITLQPRTTYTYKVNKLNILKGVDLSNPCGLGKFNIGAVLDPGSKIRESNETNNTSFREFILSCN
ncbi:MAG: hypothetical protein ACOYOA_14130 [Saprospiraceae bacterium]